MSGETAASHPPPQRGAPGAPTPAERALLVLIVAVALGAAIAASAGLLWSPEGAARAFTTVRGETVELYGRSLYRHDWAFKAPIQRGTDFVILLVGLPFLGAAARSFRRGHPRGRLLLLGALTVFLYDAVSRALGVAYNELFLVYVAQVGASVYAFVLAFATIDLDALAGRVSPRLPRRSLAALLFVASLSACVWLLDVVGAMVAGTPPHGLASYTTEATYVIDVGLVAPTCVLAGVCMLRGAPLGIPLAASLLSLLAVIGLIVAGQSVAQWLEGVVLTPGQVAAYVAPFLVLSALAAGLLRSLLRSIDEPAR